MIETDVLVVGAGPCGAMAANLLGVYGVRTLLVDREREIVAFPRAVGIDDESLRTCQAAGLVDEVLADCVQNTPIRYHTSWGRCFAHVKPSAQPYGWPRRNLFLQPLLEATLRAGLARFPHVDVRLGCELTALATDGDGVTATLAGADGGELRVRARYLVGTDGGRSTVRRLAGIELTGTTAPTRWLVVDVADDQLDAPYSGVYCHPDHPVLMVPLPYRHRRWEFRLETGDASGDASGDTAGDASGDPAASPEAVMARLAPHYGATPLPRIVSCRVYLHHSRIAERFQAGRVFLAGDAAHLQPPFFGQGMNSGMRDVTNLTWKLAAVTAGRAAPRLLDTYDTERRRHAAEMVWFATRMGKLYTPRNAVTEHARDLGFRALTLVPGGKEYLLQMKFKPMPRYVHGAVVGAEPHRRDHPVGRMFGQPAVETGERQRRKLDDAIGPWFAVIGIGVDPAEHLGDEARRWWDALGARLVSVVSPRLRPRPGATVAPVTPAGSLALVDVDGGLRDLKLARPADEIVVLRPDRYVAAVCTAAGLERATAELRAIVSP